MTAIPFTSLTSSLPSIASTPPLPAMSRPPSEHSRPLTGSRQNSAGARRSAPPLSPRTDEQEQAAEEGAASPNGVSGGGHINSEASSAYGDDDKLLGGKKRGTSKDAGDWNDLLNQAHGVGQQWKRTWDKDGLEGCVSSRQSSRCKAVAVRPTALYPTRN